jgi:hypothetical protein
MLMLGLGEAGKNIAKLFKPHTKNYKIIIFDENDGLEPRATVEEYDEQEIKLKHKGLSKHDEAMLFVCGSGKVAGATLRLLEALKGFKTTVVYIVPDLEFSSDIERMRHKAHFGILQEYTRSGMIHEMIVLDNKKMFEVAGTGTTLKYYEKVNFFVYTTIQNIMYCRHVKPDFGRLHEKKEISRISTIGLGKFRDQEKLLFLLDNITETCYIINIEEEDLDNDESIIPSCQEIIRENKLLGRNSSFAIWKSSDENHFFSIHYTHFIQE